MMSGEAGERLENWEVPGMHEYDGVKYCSVFPKESLEKVTSFNLTSQDILLPTLPKSGTVWLAEIVWLICNEVDVEGAKKVHSRQRAPIIELVIPGMTPSVDLLAKQLPPRILNTHLLPNFFEEKIKKEQPKVIVLLRNPKDNLVSLYHFYRAAPLLGSFPGSWSEFFDLYLQDKKLVSSNFVQFITEWWKLRNLPNVLVLHYEDMKADHEGNVRKLAKFLDKDLSDEEVQTVVHHTSFTQMKGNPMTQLSEKQGYNSKVSEYIRKGCVGDWKNYFTVAQNEIFDAIIKEGLAGTGIEMKYEL